MRFQRTRWIPEDATPIEEPGLGVVYVYPYNAPQGGRYFGVVAYREKAIKSDFCYIYKTDAEVDRKVAAFFDGIRQHKQMVKDRRDEYNKPHTFKVGDIITNSWGYDQTNVDWYRVTRTTEHYVWLKRVAANLQHDEGAGPMSGHERLALDENLKPIDLDEERYPETKHKATGDAVTMRHGTGSKWTGQSEYRSWYA